MNLGSWSSYLPRFEDLLRPAGIDPLGEVAENVEAARGREAAGTALAAIEAVLPDAVFGGRRDWYDLDSEWVLRSLGRALSLADEQEVLSLLGQGTAEALGEALGYIAGRLGAWRENSALQQPSQTHDEHGPALLTGVANTENWQSNRIPGTYYYAFADGEYLYGDESEAPADAWAALSVRERLAAEAAQPWGESGWFYTPTGTPGVYGGDHVYAASQSGPWMTMEQATDQLHHLAQQPSTEQGQGTAAPGRYTAVEAVSEHPGWAVGYDSDENVWKYARADGGGLPGDEAAWAAVNTFRANNTEYFAGPGHADTGWLPYKAEPDTHVPAQEDVESIMRELIDENPAIADVDEDVRRRIVIKAINQVLSEES